MCTKILKAATPKQLLALIAASLVVLGPTVRPIYAADPAATFPTSTPIKHLVVIFNENISFDHYFGTYPVATNPAGEPPFTAKPGTPTVNGYTQALLTHNPNLNPANGPGATNPFRLDNSQAVTADQNHDYMPEQQAFDMGAMDLFPAYVGTAGPPPTGVPIVSTPGLNLGYYDGNTVTAMWNYAQYFAMNDNSYSTTFGPSSVGAINMFSGQTNGATATLNGTGDEVNGGSDGSLTVIGDPDPIGDTCSSSTRNQVTMGGKNIADLLKAGGITYGSFLGGFNLSMVNSNGTTGCARSSTGLSGTTADYVPHHSWPQYYPSSANLLHTRPASSAEIGHNGPANHVYDLQDFTTAIHSGSIPAVSFIKAVAYQDGHAGYSNPLDEQTNIVTLINMLMQESYWYQTAVVILYDDSDGWYDHQMAPIVNQSTGPDDALTGPGACGTALTSLPGLNPANTHALGRCGYGMRQPFMVISPYALENFVDHTLTDQSSVIRFIEDNWLHGQRIGQGSFDAIAGPITQMFDFHKRRTNGVLILSPTTGEPIQ
ncbi:MAG: alkaline phosphatase family protein [Bryobacteraceae bacterium]|jgi:phospholipase C